MNAHKITLWILIVACLVLVRPGRSLAGEQVVHLDQQAQETASGSAKDRAVVLAVVREAEGILPGRLSNERRDLLAGFLKPRSENMVLSYARLADGEASQGVWQVRVNTEALTALLKHLGLYYTLHHNLSYRLVFSEAGDSQAQEIADLEKLSGCVRGNVDFPCLDVQPGKGDTSWRGTLSTQAGEQSGSGKTLSGLWLALWSDYFSRPEHVRPFVDVVRVHIQGWSTTSGVHGFDRQLGQWPQVVDEAGLQRIVLDPEGIQGWWRITTPQEQALRRTLEKFTTSRDLKWEMEGGED